MKWKEFITKMNVITSQKDMNSNIQTFMINIDSDIYFLTRAIF